MKKLILLLFSAYLVSVNAQTAHYVNVGGSSNVFTPASISINTGDTVIWTNIGGYHNVNGAISIYPNNPAGFGNAVSASAWTFQWVFTLPGVYDYRCDPHANMGMVGSVSVANSIPGCTDSTATNYNPLATIDDSSCVYNYDCNGVINGPALVDTCGVCQLAYIYNFITHVPVFINDTIGVVLGANEILVLPNNPTSPVWNSTCQGCTDPLACNYDSTAVIDDGSCLTVYGCMDSTALNYNPMANCSDSSSCTYTISDCNGIVNGPALVDTCGVCQLAYIYNFITHVPVFINDTIGVVLGANEILVLPNNPTSPVWNSTCQGCTDPLACNYDSTAVIDDGSCLTVYGCMDSTALNYNPMANCSDSSSCISLNYTQLFFSEAAEGSSNNKYFEIHNPTNDTIDLTNYAFAKVTNGPGNGPGVYETWIDFDSGSIVLPNDVFIVAHPQADSLIIAESDMTYGSMSNGDDGFAIVYGNKPNIPVSPDSGNYIILDWVGDWNGDPGSGWDVAGINSATQNHTLVRKCSVSQGDTSWTNSAGTNATNSQWIVLSQNDWTNIGIHNICPCDSTTNAYTTIFDTICNGLSITVGSNTYDSTGVYIDTLMAFNGCDSIITTNLNVLNTFASAITIDTTICNGDSIHIGGNSFYTSGTYTEILYNQSGCDSAVTINLTVQTPVSWNSVICSGDSLVVGNSVYYTTGNYTDTLMSSIGCDSIINTNLTIYSQLLISGGIPDNTVGSGAYFSNSTQHLELSCYIGSELVSAVVYSQDTSINTFEIRDDAGNVLDSVTATIIPGGHRIYFNYQMTAGMDYELGISGLPDGLFRNNSGVNYPYNFASAAAITSSSAGGNYYYFFYDIEVRASGSAALTTNYTICDGDSITVAGNTYTVSGLYTDSLTSSIGCDSLVFSNLIVYPNVSYTNMQTICSGEITIVGNSVYDSTGVYTDTLTSWAGCDSIITTDLTVLSIAGAITTNNQTICFGDSVSVAGNFYYTTGVYNDTLQDSNGCDSIIITTLSTNSSAYSSLYGGIIDSTTGPGTFSSYNGQLNLDNSLPSILKSAKVYAQDTNTVTFELRDDNGIVLEDITHTVYPGEQRLNFNFLIPIGTNLHLGISTGGSGLYRSNTTNGGSWSYPFNIGPVTFNSANTGSTQYYYFYYDMEIMPFAQYIDTNICVGDSVQVGSNIYKTSGSYTDTLTGTWCDSVVFTNLNNFQSPNLNIISVPNPPEICLGDSIILEGSNGFTYYWWSNGQTGNRLVDNPTIDTWYSLSAKDSNNCVVKEDIWVYVDSCITGVSYTELSNQITIYPNPTKGKINIQSDLDVKRMDLYSSDGKLIKSNIKKRHLRIKVRGVYYIKIMTEKGSVVRRVVVD